MKANKLLKTLAASTMSLALLAGVTVMPAMAKNPTNTNNSVTITKAINMDGAEGAGVPTATYTFAVASLNPQDAGATELNAKAGVLGAITNKDAVQATFTDGTTETADIVLNFNMEAFTNGAGVYYYTLAENEPNVAGVAKDANTYVMKVYVKNNTEGTALEISDVTMYAQGQAEQTKVDTITNTYNTYDLTVTKSVTGDMGDKTKDFTFTITVNDPDTDPNHMYSITCVDPDQQPTVEIMENGAKTITVDMKHGESVTIKGLPEGTTYTILESNNDRYTVTYTGATQSGENQSQATGTMEANDATVTVTNRLDGTPATGIIMNVAPYALMVVIAVAGVAVFMRKRVED